VRAAPRPPAAAPARPAATPRPWRRVGLAQQPQRQLAGVHAAAAARAVQGEPAALSAQWLAAALAPPPCAAAAPPPQPVHLRRRECAGRRRRQWPP
jgi:hypothetical protein